MARHIEINPANFLTIGTIGEPGNRTFYLQGARGMDVISVVIEKIQAQALADSFENLLEELVKQYPGTERDLAQEIQLDLRLREPLDALFRVGRLALGYDEDARRVIVVAEEMVGEDDEPNVVSFWIRPIAAKTLIAHARQVVSAGRPICGNCGQPMDKSGHFCAHRNGYIK